MTYFDSVIGQDTNKSTLIELVHKQVLPHSILFYGEAGLGKLDMAIGLASLLIGRQVFSPHGGKEYLAHIDTIRSQQGESDKKIQAEGLSMYVDQHEAFWLRPVKTMLKVEQWYTLLQTYLTVTSESPRVVIIEDFQTANAVMANAMLKTIEEPPDNVYFIIITNTIHTVLPTIISRCMALPFTAVSDDIIRDTLKKEGITGDIEQAIISGHGNPALVRQLAIEGQLKMLSLAVDIMDALSFESRYFTLISLWTESLSRDDMIEVLHWIRVLARDMLALRYGATRDTWQCPLHHDTLLTMLPVWRTKTLDYLMKQSLQAEKALKLYVKTSLVVDGLIIVVHRALQEDTD